jgi:hypothetical protein
MGKDSRKNELKKAWKQQQRKELEASIPMPKSDLRELFEFLDRDGAPSCDHTLRETLAFLEKRNQDIERIIPWLREHGGYCDCEVAANVQSEFGDLII